MYGLYPSSGLLRTRARFTAYEISELHDGLGRPEYTAVLKERLRPGGLAPLVSEPTLARLCARLDAQTTPQTPAASSACATAGTDADG